MDSQEAKDNGQKNTVWWMPAIMIFLRFSAWIFVPVIIAIFLGKWLDKKFNMEPFLYLSTVGFAFLISMFGIIKGAMAEYKKIETEDKKKKEKEGKN